MNLTPLARAMHNRARRFTTTAICSALFALLTGCAATPQRGEQLARAELLALLQTLNADLLSHDSATLTLERWCSEHHLAEPARIVARRMHDGDKAIPGDLLARLAVDATEPLRYRHVQLACGERVLSEADNWYVPARLTAEMNRQLDTSEEPFGKVVKPLGFQRRTLSAELLWSPLPAQWEMQTDAATAASSTTPLRIATNVLRHRAVLYSAAQQPFSALEETYRSELFAFGRWRVWLP